MVIKRMKIAVVNEISTCQRNGAIVDAFRKTGEEIYNVGMTGCGDEPELTYLQTGLISALLLHLKLADLIVGGCGTGQGYMNAVLQYPGTSCVLVNEPLDAWLARRINAPNCISLALNKGYGWAGDVNLELIAQALLCGKGALGYPPERAKSQEKSREKLRDISHLAHHSMIRIIREMEEEIISPVYQCKGFCRLLPLAKESELKEYLMAEIKERG